MQVVLRETDHTPRVRHSTKLDDGEHELGKNEGTVRFLFGSNTTV